MSTAVLRPSEAINLSGQDTGRDALSHTKLNTFLACPRRFELHYDKRLELISRPRHLSLGSAFQLGIEYQDPEVAARAVWGLEPDGSGERIVSFTQQHEDRLHVDEAIVRGACALYLRTWPEQRGEAREVEYRVRLRNPWTGYPSRTFDLLGKADGVVDDGGWDVLGDTTGPELRLAQPLELQENKLVGSVDPAKVQRLPLDRQIALSRYGLWRATGRLVRRVRYRWVRKPSIKQRQKETVEEFCARIGEDYVDRPDFYLHEEQPVFATTEDFLRIECELWVWAEQLRQFRRDALHPRNTSSCSDFGGCAFIPICTGDPDAMSLYRERPRRELPVAA
jgi:hypothetical protein